MGCLTRILWRIGFLVLLAVVIYSQRHTVLAHQLMSWFDAGRRGVSSVEKKGFPKS